MALHHHNFTAAPYTGGGFYYGPGPAGYHHLPPAPPPPPPLARAFQPPHPPPPPPVTSAPRQPPAVAASTPRYTRVNAGSGSKTSVHAVIDYDDDFGDEDYYDDVADPRRRTQPTVTPIQGPILVKNGSVPVVPLYSYPTVNNGSLVQIPIWWTALSLALGLEIRGDVIRGTPCIKRFHQLFCPTAGNSYPIERIELFIDENKALMKRMYGEFQMTTEYGPPSRELFEGQRAQRKARAAAAGTPDRGGGGGSGSKSGTASDGGLGALAEEGESYFAKLRHTRQSFRNNQSSDTGRVDACESKVEIVTPYWAANSAGKIRAIVNTQHFEQAIHQEVCSKVQTNRCSTDCGCEQKYKWHRLLAYDPDNDCKGIFMDWFLFPSCCVCRCSANANNFRQNN